VQRDVERAGRYVVVDDLAHRAGETLRHRHTSRANADERKLLHAAVALDNLVRDPCERPAHAVRVHHQRHTDTCSWRGVELAGWRVDDARARKAIGTSSRPRRGALKRTSRL